MIGSQSRVRWMTNEELYAKMAWGTERCGVDKCDGTAAYLVEQTWSGHAATPDWWEYRCESHARQFAKEMGLSFPPATDQP